MTQDRRHDHSSQPRPPRILQWFLSAALHPADQEVVLGDLAEMYGEAVRRDGPGRAKWWYALQTVRSIPRFLIQTASWSSTMLRNYFKLAVRNLNRQKVYGAINLAGLSVGLALCILILLFVRDELTFDRFHARHADTYQIQEQVFGADGSLDDWNPNGPLPLARAVREGVPGIEASTRVWQESTFLRNGRDIFEERTLRVDPAFLEMFSFQTVLGEKASLPNDGVVITESAALRLFGGRPALGEVLEVRLANEYRTHAISGIVADPPSNSTFQFDALLPIDPWIQARFADRADAFNMSLVETYIQTIPGYDAEQLQTGLSALYVDLRQGVLDRLGERTEYEPGVQAATYHGLPLADVHLTVTSDPKYSYILSALALGILLIACINFMTLAIGRSLRRATEVGVRKVVGAQRSQLVGQFWGEALLVVSLSTALGLLAAWLALPWFNQVADKRLVLDLISDWTMTAGILGLILLTGLVAGSYPALILSAFRPVDVLKSRLRVSGANWFTRSLVALQFSLSVALIIGTLVMKRQTEYLSERDLGFDTEQVVLVELNGLDGRATARRFRTALESSPAISGITLAASALGYRGTSGMRFEHAGRMHSVDMLSIDHQFLSEMGIELTRGRAFDPLRATDSTGAVIVNEALVRDFELADPIGAQIPGVDGTTIIGVTADFNFQALYQEVGPIMMAIEDFWGYRYMYVRLAPGGVQDGLDQLRSTWAAMTGDIPFQFEFLDDRLARVYASDLRWQRIINVASMCAVFLALLGHFGLTAITIRGRAKEIGIRKVLGASAAGLMGLLSRDFLRLILIGSAIAIPASWFALDRWLTGFAFRVSLGPTIFVMAVALVVLAGLGAVGLQSMRAIRADPARALRSE